MTTAVAILAVLALSPQGTVAKTDGSSAPPPAFRKPASQTDREVLQSLALALLEDKDFPATERKDWDCIVLHLRNPLTAGMLNHPSQIATEAGGKALPRDAWDDLVRRNHDKGKPTARAVYYEGLEFDKRIVVADAKPGVKAVFVGSSFEERFPTARGYLVAFVPGFTKTGDVAVIRGDVGPVKGRATLLAILQRQPAGWTVAWKRYTVYPA